jgi:Raf kinase inhibitor-like YbhB/YbcL family protein
MRSMKRLTGLCLAGALVVCAMTASARDVGSIRVTSPAFANGGAISSEYTCEGRSISPPLSWSAPPTDAKSIAVIVEDPDAPGGTYEHFVLFNLPPSERSLPSQSSVPSTKGLVARNSGNGTGFAPICPPSGRHHYRFQVLALDTVLPRPIPASAADVANAINGHVLARGELTGLYQKSSH